MCQGDNTIKVSLSNAVIGTVGLSYERVLGNALSAQITVSSTDYSYKKFTYKGFAVSPEVRFIAFDEESANYSFVAPFIRYQRFNLSQSYIADSTGNSISGTSTALVNAGSIGFIGGRQWILMDRIALEVFAGPVFVRQWLQQTDNAPFHPAVEPDNNLGGLTLTLLPDGLFMRVGVNLGITF